MAGLDKVVDSILDSIDKAQKTKTSSYDASAVVKRIEGDTAWVHIPGGVEETPVKMTINAKVGDSVKIRVGGRKAWITGNASAPPTDDTEAEVAQEKADYAQNIAEGANENAESALKSAGEAYTKATSAIEIAGNTEQHFFFTETGTDTGAHITEIPKEEFIENPSGGNLLARSNGIAIRDGLDEIASFGETSQVIGSNSTFSFNSNGISLSDDEGTYFDVHKTADGDEFTASYKSMATISPMSRATIFTSGKIPEFDEILSVECYFSVQGWQTLTTTHASIGYIDYDQIDQSVTIYNMTDAQNSRILLSQGLKIVGIASASQSMTFGGDVDFGGDLNVDGCARFGYATVVGGFDVGGRITADSIDTPITTGTATESSSVVTACTWAMVGNCAQLRITVSPTSTVAAGGDFVASLQLHNLPKPALNSSGVNYTAGRPIIASLTTAGAITVRNCGSTSVTSGSTVNAITVTYLTDRTITS